MSKDATPVAESVEQVDYAREALSRQQAEQIVAARIDEWGWGPLSEADGCAEHELAVKACQAGLAAAYEAGRAEGVREAAEVADRIREQLNGGRFATWSTGELAAQCKMQARDNLDPEYSQFMDALSDRLRALSKEPTK